MKMLRQYIVLGLLVSAIALANNRDNLESLLQDIQACMGQMSEKLKANPPTFIEGYTPTRQEQLAAEPQIIDATRQLNIIKQAIEDVVIEKGLAKQLYKGAARENRLSELRKQEDLLKKIRAQGYGIFIAQNPKVYFNLGDLTIALHRAGSESIASAETITAMRSRQWNRLPGTVTDAVANMLVTCKVPETPNVTPIMPQEEIMLPPEEDAPIFMKKPEGEVTILPVFEQAEEIQMTAPEMEQALPIEKRRALERKRVVAYRGKMASRLSQQESFAGVTIDTLNELLNEIHKDFNDYSEQAFVEDPSITPRLLTELYNEAKKVCDGFATANVTLFKNPTSRANFEKIKDEHLDAMSSVLKSYSKKK